MKYLPVGLNVQGKGFAHTIPVTPPAEIQDMGAQGLLLAGKVHALLDGRFSVSADDIRRWALPVLRHPPRRRDCCAIRRSTTTSSSSSMPATCGVLPRTGAALGA